MKKIKLLKSIFIFSILFPAFAFYGCATKQNVSEIENTEITAPEDEETLEDEIDETPEEIEISGSETDSDTDETDSTEESENEISDDTEDDIDDDFEELPEIDEPEVFDDELPPEEIIEEEPAVEIEEEKIIVEEVEDIPEFFEETNDDKKTQIEIDDDIKIGIITIDDEDDEIDEIDESEDATEITTIDVAIDITNEEESLEEEVSEVEIIPSRSVTLKVGEYLEIDYPGRGWIYMGSTDGSKNLTSAGRNLGDKDTNFTLLARNEGTSILHFYKEDVLAGVYIDDYIEVTVEPTKSSSKTRVKAPSYAETVPKQPEKKSTNTQTSTTQNTTPKTTDSPVQTATTQLTTNDYQPATTTEQTSPAPTTASPTQTTTTQPSTQPAIETPLPSADELLKSAYEKFNSKNYDGAKTDLEIFLTIADSDRDEALYLLAQIYESNSKSKDIKKAIETYEQLMSNYPASRFWDDANKRVIYLKRFYINVR